MKYIAGAIYGASMGWAVGVIIYYALAAIVWIIVYTFEGYPK